jgi:AraC-like DNA-binding protein/quercetin dioxygenase-like cupin family protein
MDQYIWDRLTGITTEEQAILAGRSTIDRDIYMDGNNNRINAQKLLADGKLITFRPHTRFIHFPEHTHDYIEAVYMCAGSTVHIVNGCRIELRQGELLFMNQSATHEILEAKESDVAVNFIILPEFFGSILTFMGEEETPLRRFLVDCLCGQSNGAGFLYFKAADIVPVQNLIENLLFTLMQDAPNKRKMSQVTMTLLFMQLMGHAETLQTADTEQTTVLKVLSYVETHYAEGSLTELAQQLRCDLYTLSREIKRKTGKTYTLLMQEKRLAQAAFLLKNTDRNVDDIAGAVGYENMGYFHRLFKEAYGVSPRHYRMQIR